MSEKERRQASDEIFSQLLLLPRFERAATVGLYVSLPDEPRTDDFLDFLSGRKRVVIPRVEGEEILFCDYRPGSLVRGAFGILEPAEDASRCAVGDIDLLVVPGTAFTPDGRRMGRGGGFYDRLLARPDFRAFTVGVCFSFRLLDSLPAEPHDKTVDLVICN